MRNYQLSLIFCYRSLINKRFRLSDINAVITNLSNIDFLTIVKRDIRNKQSIPVYIDCFLLESVVDPNKTAFIEILTLDIISMELLRRFLRDNF